VKTRQTREKHEEQRHIFLLQLKTHIAEHRLFRHALKFGSQKINLHLSGKEFEPKAERVQPGSGDLCFITETPIEEVLAAWKGAGIEVRDQRIAYLLVDLVRVIR
jgi:hypothetical protein